LATITKSSEMESGIKEERNSLKRDKNTPNSYRGVICDVISFDSVVAKVQYYKCLTTLSNSMFPSWHHPQSPPPFLFLQQLTVQLIIIPIHRIIFISYFCLPFIYYIYLHSCTGCFMSVWKNCLCLQMFVSGYCLGCHAWLIFMYYLLLFAPGM
jgi:hypothetical protein